MILVTGCAGYLGSHTATLLLSAGHPVFIADNLCNSKISVLSRIEKISGRRPEFSRIDIRDREALRDLLSKNRFDAVIHLARLKTVGESVAKPFEYYKNNIVRGLTLFECMAEAHLKNLVFRRQQRFMAIRPRFQFGKIFRSLRPIPTGGPN